MSQRRAVAFVLYLGLTACGGNGDGGGGGGETPVNFTNFQIAGDILGQATTTGDAANNGGATNSVGFNSPFGHVANGSLYVADRGNHRLLGWNASPTGLGPPADFVVGQIDFTSNSAGTTDSKFNIPMSCWVASNALFVAENANNRVLMFSPPPTGSVAASLVLGKPDFTTGGQTAGQAGLSAPTAVCVAANRIVVADQLNRRVMVWNGIPGMNGADAQIVVGQPDFGTVTAGATASKMGGPLGVWTDGTRLVVADSVNHRVLVWTTFPTSNGQAADVVVGQPDFTTNTSGAGAQKFNFPVSVTSDGSQLFVVDQINNRVLIFSPFPTSSNPVATGVLGQSNFTNTQGNDDDQDGVLDATPSARTMRGPGGAQIVGNRLYVCDGNNNRVLVFTGS